MRSLNRSNLARFAWAAAWASNYKASQKVKAWLASDQVGRCKTFRCRNSLNSIVATKMILPGSTTKQLAWVMMKLSL